MTTSTRSARSLLAFALLACLPALAPVAAQTRSTFTTEQVTPKSEFEQAANNHASANAGDVVWTGQTLNQGNSIYYEGMSVPQRLYAYGLSPGGNDGQGNHKLRFTVQSTKNAIHVYDFLTSWQQAVDVADSISPPPADLLPTLIGNRCNTAIGEATDVCSCLAYSFDAPIDDTIEPIGGPGGHDDVQARMAEFETRFGDRAVQLFSDAPVQSALVDFIGYTNPDAGGDTYSIYEVRWSSASTRIRLELASHLACSSVPGVTDALDYDVGFGSANVDNGPFHFRLGSVNRGTFNPADNRITSSDILNPPPEGCNIVGPDRVCGGGQVTYSVSPAALSYSWSILTTSTANCPAVGTSDAFFCGPTNQQTVCVNPGTIDSRFVLQVTVTNASGTSTCCLSIHTIPSTGSSPISDVQVCTGQPHTFCTTPSGQGPFTFEWRKNGATIPGATNSCYTATAGPAGVNDQYCVLVTGSGPCGATFTDCATLMSIPNANAGVLVSVRRCEGTTHNFCITTSGTGPFTYSWAKNGTAIPGATNSCYTATAGPGGTADQYCVTVTGGCGPPLVRCATLTADSNATATAINDATVCEGLQHQFCTTAGGTGPFTYSWTKNGSAIAGATSSCFTATAGSGGTVDTYCVTVTGDCSTASDCATLTASSNVTASSLTNATKCEGLTHQFCTTAGGTGPFTYSWTKNGSAIAGATDSCFTATAGAGGSVDTYCVTVDGDCGPPVTRCANLTADSNATASALGNATVCEGGTHQFCTTAGGTGPFTYSWTMNGSAIAGATNSCFTATAGTGGTVDTYCVTVDGECGTASSCGALTATTNATTSDPADATKCEGQTHQFCTTAGGTGPFTYSWTKNGSAIDGASDSCYTATAGSGGTVDTYCVTVDGDCGTPVTQCATLTSTTNVTATALSNGSACEGLTHQFCTTAGGSGPFTYSWTKNGSAIGGATNSCHTATAGTGGTVDTYCVTVSGACGTPVTRCATLTATTNVTATALSNASACEGVTQQFCTTAGGTGPFTYSWTKNGSAIGGATNSCHTATAGTGGTVDTYCVTVSGACGTPVTRCATLTAKSNVTATTLSNANACEGQTQQFCTTAGGTGPFTYSWTKNGSAIGGATNSCHTATAGTGGTVDTYCVTVSGVCGTPVTRCATLTAKSNATATALTNASDCEGEQLTFCTTAGGTGPFSYQWSRNGTSVPGQTNSCYTFVLASGDTQVCVTVTGACGPSAQRCATLTVEDCGGAHCTLTQGGYGNAGGQFNGIGRLNLITQLLQGGLTVGVPGTRSLTIQGTAASAQCIIDRLPTSGTPSTMPNFGDETLDSSDCQTSPTPIPLQNGRFQNVLLGQVITLSLNMRLSQGVTSPNGCVSGNSSLGIEGLCHTMTSRAMLPGPDGCKGTADDVPDSGNLMTLTIPQAVLDSLASLSLPQTVGGLLQLGNRALAGMSTGTASITQVNEAVDGINNLFDECRELVSCTDP